MSGPLRRFMARKPAPGDPVLVDRVPYQVTTGRDVTPDVIYVERPCACEWLLLDLGQMRWDRLRGYWRASRAAALAAGGNR